MNKDEKSIVVVDHKAIRWKRTNGKESQFMERGYVASM